MKKAISLLLAVLMLVSVVPMAASATTCAHENTEYHPYQPWVCEQQGYFAGTWCNDCETWIEGHGAIENPGRDKGHKFVFDHKVESTCTMRGYDMRKCTLCGATSEGVHNYDLKPHEYEYTINEGYGVSCYRDRECVNCDKAQSGRNEATNGRHIDEDNDKVCDFCHRDFSGCNHMCHKGGFLWTLVKLFLMMFDSGQNCKCGYPHY